MHATNTVARVLSYAINSLCSEVNNQLNLIVLFQTVWCKRIKIFMRDVISYFVPIGWLRHRTRRPTRREHSARQAVRRTSPRRLRLHLRQGQDAGAARGGAVPLDSQRGRRFRRDGRRGVLQEELRDRYGGTIHGLLSFQR